MNNPRGWEYEKRMKFENFSKIIQTEYKELKKKTHFCQAKCYENIKTTINEATECASKCNSPFNSAKKFLEHKVIDCENNYRRNDKECWEIKSKLKAEECFAQNVLDYESCLLNLAPEIKLGLSAFCDKFGIIISGSSMERNPDTSKSK